MEELARPALDAVLNNEVNIHPPKFRNVYKHWMENVRDWCVSRQLWWGHRIPAYFYNGNDFVVAETIEEAVEKARAESGNAGLSAFDLRQDEDVLDTWFSSWLWPITCFNGILDPDNDDIKYYYPTNALITAPEILFFWVARMIISGYEYRGEKPFSDVYLHGLVRDKQRKKMSKSLGNSPDPISLITKYGADGVRVGMLLCSPAGNDLLYDDGLPEQGRNYANKIWNAFRLVKTWDCDDTISQPEWSTQAIEWFDNRLSEAIIEYNKAFDNYRISDALMIVYRLFWDDFSSWYLEAVKPDYQKPIDRKTLDATIDYFDKLIRLIHPFMPFITEEIWQLLKERKADESIMLVSQPEGKSISPVKLKDFDIAKQLIGSVRTVRKEKNIPNREDIELLFTGKSELPEFSSVIKRLGHISSFRYVDSKPEGAVSFIVGTTEFFIPVGEKMDIGAEIEKVKADLDYQRGFLNTIMKKLGNRNFVDNAPEKVVGMERKKQSDAETKIKVLEKRLEELSR
jgi:valyl-tRNA synthetase